MKSWKSQAEMEQVSPALAGRGSTSSTGHQKGTKVEHQILVTRKGKTWTGQMSPVEQDSHVF